MKRFLLCFWAVIIGLVSVGVMAPLQVKAAVQYTYYASPAGSGSTRSLALPCSLTCVQSKVRTVNAAMTGDIQVMLRGGQYNLTSPLTLTESDSGLNVYPLILESSTI